MSKIKWTDKQREALKLLGDETKKHILLFGGARSGKTFLIVSAIVYRAIKYPNTRHLIARLRFAHAKLSIWMDTLREVLASQVPRNAYIFKESDHFVQFANGSEIWVDGLDDKDRVEKILGREYATVFFNEISQIAYDTVTTVHTRLSQKVDGCRNVALYDCNPGGRAHWANSVFIDGKTPSGEPVGNEYAHMLVNPEDNRENLPEGFIEEILDRLPEHKRRRFRLGMWTDPEGVIFRDWQMVDQIPEEVRLHSRHTYGLDFGFSVDPAALVDIYINGDDIYLDELLYDTGINNTELAERMRGITEDAPIYADSAEPKSIDELHKQGYNVHGATKGPDSVRVGIDWMLARRLYVTERSVNLINELSNYSWQMDQSGMARNKPIDDYNHAIDAIRYGCSEHIDVYRGRIADYDFDVMGTLGL